MVAVSVYWYQYVVPFGLLVGETWHVSKLIIVDHLA